MLNDYLFVLQAEDILVPLNDDVRKRRKRSVTPNPVEDFEQVC